MNKTLKSFMLIMALVAAFFGGMLCSNFFTPNSALAQRDAPTGVILKWENVISEDGTFDRARVADGWLVKYSGNGLTFVPDPEHKWK